MKYTITVNRAELCELIYRLSMPHSDAATKQEIRTAEQLQKRLEDIRDEERKK